MIGKLGPKIKEGCNARFVIVNSFSFNLRALVCWDLGTVAMLWFKFTCGTIWHFPLLWCMVMYCNVYETNEDTKFYQG